MASAAGRYEPRALWASLDLLISSGCARYSLPLVRAAAAKAGGQLRSLDITGQQLLDLNSDFLLLLDVVKANPATLTVLRVDTESNWIINYVRQLLQAAHAMQLFEASLSVLGDHQVARAMLRNGHPFRPFDCDDCMFIAMA